MSVMFKIINFDSINIFMYFSLSISLFNLKSMKRLSLYLAGLFIIALIASSCASSRNCPAYGETKQYQKSYRP